MTLVTVRELVDDPDPLDQQLSELIVYTKKSNSDFLLLPGMPFSRWVCTQENVTDLDWLKAVDQHQARRFT